MGLPQLPQNVPLGVVAEWLAFLRFDGVSSWPASGLTRGHERLLRLLKWLLPGSVLLLVVLPGMLCSLVSWVGCMGLGVVAGGFAVVAAVAAVAAPWVRFGGSLFFFAKDFVLPCGIGGLYGLGRGC